MGSYHMPSQRGVLSEIWHGSETPGPAPRTCQWLATLSRAPGRATRKCVVSSACFRSRRCDAGPMLSRVSPRRPHRAVGRALCTLARPPPAAEPSRSGARRPRFRLTCSPAVPGGVYLGL